MFDLDALLPTMLCPARPRLHRVVFERHRRDRWQASSVIHRLFPDDTVGRVGTYAAASQEAAYFEAFDAWWCEQDPDRPAAERFNEFLRLYESGAFNG